MRLDSLGELNVRSFTATQTMVCRGDWFFGFSSAADSGRGLREVEPLWWTVRDNFLDSCSFVMLAKSRT